MISLILLFFAICINATSAIVPINACAVKNDDFRKDFNLTALTGQWYVVAMIPEYGTDNSFISINCYKVEFSETEPAGFKWLLNKTYKSEDLLRRVKGTIVRQRYHSIPPYDVWSKAIDGVPGCFRQILSLDTDKKDLGRPFYNEAHMQLHLMEVDNPKGPQPIMLQMLYGNVISVVIYKKILEISPEELRVVSEKVTKIRGKMSPPKLCNHQALPFYNYKQFDF